MGLLAKWQDNEQARYSAQSALILSVPEQLHFLSRLEPDDEKLANFAITLYPEHPEVLAWRAHLLREREPEQAIELYQQALTLNSSPYEWWLGLSNAYESLGHYEAALAAYDIGCEKVKGVVGCHRRWMLLQKLESP